MDGVGDAVCREAATLAEWIAQMLEEQGMR